MHGIFWGIPGAAPFKAGTAETIYKLVGEISYQFAVGSVRIRAGVEIHGQTPGVHGHDTARFGTPDIEAAIISLEFPQ